MSLLTLLIMLVAVSVICARVFCLMSRLDSRSFEGHPIQFWSIAAGHALLAGGAGALFVAPHWAPILLACGIAVVFLSDRRYHI